MHLIPIKNIVVNTEKIRIIDAKLKSIYRIITFSRYHLADDLLDTFLSSIQNLAEILSIKNAQMEAQDDDEATLYIANMKKTLEFIVEELKVNRNFEQELQLFQLLRIASPETHAAQPNRYRNSIVQIGAYICPEPNEVPSLVAELFYQLQFIENPIVRAVYFHHELIRIHPFVDGNGRVTRIAQNWLLMHDLYPPMFIKDAAQKKEYISTLGNSFRDLQHAPHVWSEHTEQFFEQEIDRLLISVNSIYDIVYRIGAMRE